MLNRTMKLRKSTKRFIILSLTMLLLASTWTASPSQAAVPQLDQIRVALFSTYTETTAAATFASASGLSVGGRTPEGSSSWFTVEANTQIRFGADDFKVMVLETATFATALAAYNKLQAAKGAAFLTSVSKNKGVLYQVLEGTYATAADATAAQKKWAADSGLTAITGSFKSVLQGPLHLETAAYAGKAEAAEAAAAFGAVGVDAYVAVRGASKADSAAYSVMVGSAISAAELQLIKTAASKAAGGAALNTADAKTPYLLQRLDHGVTGRAETSLELYAFGGSDPKVTIAPGGKEPIQVTERSNRKYRGSIELALLNNKMAVINELPFEQYLYSVVGIEMYPSWPAEALKAQAVAARTYVLQRGLGFKIAHVVDTTLSQAYYGVQSETPTTIAAVDATAGEVVLYNGKPIETLYSSSSGGMTADAKEIWGNEVAYLKPVKSPDESSQAGLQSWYRVVLPSGDVGYIREDLLTATTRKTAAGSAIMTVNTNGAKVRKHPLIQDNLPLIGQLDNGAEVTVLEKTIESNPNAWVRGPFTADEMLTAINSKALSKVSGPIRTLAVSQRGASGRAIEVVAGGQKVDVKYPDSLRGTLGVNESLPSTLFDIEQTAALTMLGSGNAKADKTSAATKVYAISAGGQTNELSQNNQFVLDGKGNVRAATKDTAFRFVGAGYGHGLGMSQFGALGLARQGYDYQYILKYYYKDVTIAKE
jgi:stage II sporulation protein D